MGAIYGLRRSEVSGLKWDAIDFEHNTIIIRHTVTSCMHDGKRITVAQDTTKTKSSLRTLPLVPFVKERLLALKAEQEENRRLCGRNYNKKYLDYICVNEIGDLISPHYISECFSKFLSSGTYSLNSNRMATHPKKERAALAGGLPRQILSFNVRNQQGFKVNKNLSG